MNVWRQVIVNIERASYGVASVLTVIAAILTVAPPSAGAQEKVPAFEDLLKRPVALRPELAGVHPRVFFTKSEIDALRERAHGAGREEWSEVRREVDSFGDKVPDPNDEDLYRSGIADDRKKGSMTQYSLALRISQTAFAYSIDGDERDLARVRKLLGAAVALPFWGYRDNKPNVDLPPAHLLYALGFAYDLLFDRLPAAERDAVRDKLRKQGALMYDYFKYKPNKRYTYSQNHTWIPLAGLAVAAYALMGEAPEAQDWARLARSVFDRTMLTFGTDGFFYESFHYYGFAFRWMIIYFDAHRHATGEDLYAPMQPKFKRLKYFAMHSVLPDGKNVFDIADIGDGSLNRNGTSERESLYSEYAILYRLAGVYRDEDAQAAADFLHYKTKLATREPMWSFVNHDPTLAAAGVEKIPLGVFFNDNDTLYRRTSWRPDALAFSFRCAPPEGHHAARLAASVPDWRQNTGHAHPDANSFIIYGFGDYLTGDTGYLGLKRTDDHNTVLVGGRGQEKDGIYEMFKDVPNARLDKIRVADISGNSDYNYVRGEAAAGYYADLGVRKFDRHFLYVEPGYFVVWDELETDKPSEFTFMLNADREIALTPEGAELRNTNAFLRVVRLLPATVKPEAVPQIVAARGLPGSVDKGVEEQRGMQYRETASAAGTTFEFLHFLQPVRNGDKTPAPKVEATDAGLKITFANGDVDEIALRGAKRKIARTRGGKKMAVIEF